MNGTYSLFLIHLYEPFKLVDSLRGYTNRSKIDAYPPKFNIEARPRGMIDGDVESLLVYIQFKTYE